MSAGRAKGVWKVAFDRTEVVQVPAEDGEGARKLHLWIPKEAPRALVLIVHGMAEHIARYDLTARDLCERGFLAAGADLRGHGPDCPREKLGYFGPKNGWDLVLGDIRREAEALTARFPGVPLVLLGHSMGSFLAREYVLRWGDTLSALILSGTGNYERGVVRAGLALAGMLPAGKPAGLVDKIAFSGNNKPFAPARTPFDWLSRDKAQVDRYASDPLCGFPFTAQAYRDFFSGLLRLTETDRLDGMPHDLPVLFISGASDPVGGMGRGVEKTAADFRAHGMKSVTVRLFPEARHELFNETCRDEAVRDVCTFIAGIL